MRICVYGEAGHYGYVSEAVAVNPDLSVVGIASDRTCTNLKKAFPNATEYRNLETMLDEEKPDLFIATPEFDKTANAIMEALKRKIAVYADKPLALDLGKLDQLYSCWQENHVPLGAMFGITEESWFKTLKAAVVAGKIGEVRLMHGQKSYKLGQRPEFYKHRESFGGLIPWVAIHALDWVMAFGDEAEWVSAASSDACNRNHGDLEVSAAVLVQFKNGAIATVNADYFRPTGSERHDDDRLRITGTKGMIEAIGHRVFLENEEKRQELPLMPPGNCVLNFIEKIKNKSSGEETERAFKATRIALKARDAADRKSSVRL